MVIHAYYGNVSESERVLPFYAVTVGESRPQSAVHRPAGINDYQLLYTVSGVGRVRIRDKYYEVKEGDIFILPPFTPHEYSPQTDNWVTLWITYNGTAAKTCFPFSADIRKDVNFQTFYRRIYKGKKLSEWRRKTSPLLYELLMLVWENQGLLPEKRNAKDPDIGTAVQYIAEHFRQTVELSTLAQISGLSEGHFCRVFKNHTHMRPIEYIINLRIESAKDLLLEKPERQISDIAALVGYSSASYFSKNFREKTGMSPDEYRKKHNIAN